MSTQNISWYNPLNITQEQLQPEDGWRFLVEGEKSGLDCQWFSHSKPHWNEVLPQASWFVSEQGERTKRPLPEKYRVAAPAPSPEPEVEPDYNSREHKLAVLAAALDGEKCEVRLNPHSNWIEAGGLADLAMHLSHCDDIRIKPKAPPAPVFVDVPLEFNDWLNGPWEVCSDPEAPYPTIDLVVAFNHLDICTATHGCTPILDRTRHVEAMNLWRRKVGVPIWRQCKKQVERKG